jgi:hypothetical protein
MSYGQHWLGLKNLDEIWAVKNSAQTRLGTGCWTFGLAQFFFFVFLFKIVFLVFSAQLKRG